ncbi:MAG: hypothetical protein U0Z53_07820 [Blastocatellia bacterium]
MKADQSALISRIGIIGVPDLTVLRDLPKSRGTPAACCASRAILANRATLVIFYTELESDLFQFKRVFADEFGV